MQIPTAPLEDFFPLIRPQASACPVPQIEQELRGAAIEFCERTRCWRSIVTKPIVRNRVTLIAPVYAVIHEIEEASFNGQPLVPTQFTSLMADVTPEYDDPLTGCPVYITQDTPGSVLVFPFQEGALTISAFLKPRASNQIPAASTYAPGDADINVLPQFLLHQFGEALAAGALSRILTIPRQEYTDMQRAAMFRDKFQRAMDAHFSRNIRGQHRAPRRSQPNYL